MHALRYKMIRELELHRKYPRTGEAEVTAVAQQSPQVPGHPPNGATGVPPFLQRTP